MAKSQVGFQAASLLIWLLIFLPHREAHGAGPERGTERKGQERLVTWGRAAFRFSK